MQYAVRVEVKMTAAHPLFWFFPDLISRKDRQGWQKREGFRESGRQKDR